MRSSNIFKHNLRNLHGLVLSGGQSTRMGTDKGEIKYHDKTQRQYVYELLSAHCAATFISCNAQQSKQINWPKIVDAFPNIGPLGGVLSAFQFKDDVAWLVVACDMPFLNNETINYLIQHRNPQKSATGFLDDETKLPEPLVTIWESCAYPVLSEAKHNGQHSLKKILINSDAKILNAPNYLALKNINTKDEYKKALKLLNKQAQ